MAEVSFAVLAKLPLKNRAVVDFLSDVDTECLRGALQLNLSASQRIEKLKAYGFYWGTAYRSFDGNTILFCFHGMFWGGKRGVQHP